MDIIVIRVLLAALFLLTITTDIVAIREYKTLKYEWEKQHMIVWLLALNLLGLGGSLFWLILGILTGIL